MTNAVPIAMTKRLAAWAYAYGGEQHQRSGYSSLHHIGDPAANDSIDASAEQLERIVCAMEMSGRWKEARVLRAEYFMATLPEHVRLSRLKRMGLSISRTSYYVYLDTAHAFLAGALSITSPSPEG